MKHRVPIAALLCLLLAAPSANAGKSTGGNAIEQTLTQLERDYSVAYLNHDLATIDRILADDYVGIDGRAVVSNKAQELDEAKAPEPGSAQPDYLVTDEILSELRVRAYGDAAVVTGLSTEKVLIKGNATTVRYRRTSVYIRRQGRWRCVSFHATRLNAIS